MQGAKISIKAIGFGILISLFVLCTSTLTAQNSSTPGHEPPVPTTSTHVVKGLVNDSGSDVQSDVAPDFMRFEVGNEINYHDFQTYFRETFDLRNDDGLKLVKTETDQIGFTHYRFQQWYGNFPVEFGEYLVHVKNGKVISMNGRFIPEIQAASKPTITEKQALQTALNHVGADKYLWENTEEEAIIKKATGNPNATHFPTGKLVIFPDQVDESKASLVWRFRYLHLQ